MPSFVSSINREVIDLDDLVSMVERREKVEYEGSTKTFTIRVPALLADWIDAMAAHGNVSRQVLCVDLLDFAVGEVEQHLSEESRNTLAKWIYEASLRHGQEVKE